MVVLSLNKNYDLTLILSVTGAIVLFNSMLKIAVSVYKTFFRPGKKLVKLGKWAIITGATDGIGKAYALELAHKGMSIVLISRTETKLQYVKNEIDAKKYPNVEVKYLGQLVHLLIQYHSILLFK